MAWECCLTPSLTPIPAPTSEQWEGVLASSDPNDQLQLAKRARLAATAQGLLDGENPSPPWAPSTENLGHHKVYSSSSYYVYKY